MALPMESVIIIGSGPAGLTAGIYAAWAGLSPVVLEGLETGGQLALARQVANYPGFPEATSGSAIIAALHTQAEKAGVRFAMDVVESVDLTGTPLLLHTLTGATLRTRAVIVATGSEAAEPDRMVPADGLSRAAARRPRTAFLGTALVLDATGHVVVDGVRASVPGVFAAGDCVRPLYGHAAIAAGDGAMAAFAAQRYLVQTRR